MNPLFAAIGAAAVLVAALVWQTVALRRANSENARLEAAAAVCETANKGQAKVIERLEAANRQWGIAAETAQAESRLAAETAASQIEKLNLDLAAARQDRKTVYAASPAAKAWSEVEVPPAVVDKLRRSEP